MRCHKLHTALSSHVLLCSNYLRNNLTDLDSHLQLLYTFLQGIDHLCYAYRANHDKGYCQRNRIPSVQIITSQGIKSRSFYFFSRLSPIEVIVSDSVVLLSFLRCWIFCSKCKHWICGMDIIIEVPVFNEKVMLSRSAQTDNRCLDTANTDSNNNNK